MRHMLSPSVDGKTGTGTLSQVQACQRQVSELRASLSLLAERCGCLEDVHKGAIDRLRVFGSPKPGATLEQLKKQSMAKVKALQSRHGELMSKLQEELSLSCERSEPMPMTEKVKTPAVLKGAAAVQSPDLSKPEADDGAGLAAPLTLESENGHEQMDVSSVTVMPMDGRVGKLNSRLRHLSQEACGMNLHHRGFGQASWSVISSVSNCKVSLVFVCPTCVFELLVELS